MRFIIIITLMLFSSMLLFAQQFQVNTPEGSVSMSITGIQNNGNTTSGNIIDQIASKLEQLEKDCHSKLNKVDQMKAKRLMDEVYGLLALLPTDQNMNINQHITTSSSTTTTATPNGNINININGMNQPQEPAADVHQPGHGNHHQQDVIVKEEKPDHGNHHPQVEESTKRLISENDMSSLVEKINAESFSDGKLRVLRTASKNYRFNVNQIILLINAYTFSEDKIEALRLSYPEVTNPQDNYKILDAFTYDSDKETAESIINR